MGNDSSLEDTVARRSDVLTALEQGQRTKRDIVESIDRSRSTVNRAVKELLNAECITPLRPGNSRYQLTTAGRLALEMYRDYHRGSDTVESNAALLNTLSADVGVSEDFITDADVYSFSKAPDLAHNPSTELVADATRFYGTAPVVFDSYFEFLNGWTARDGTDLELVLDRDLLDSIVEHYDAEFTELRSHSGVDLLVTDESFSHAVWVVENAQETHAGLTIYEDGAMRANLLASSDRAVLWAEQEYQRYRDAATPFGIGD